jgi:prophage regulatory protein
MRNPADAVLSLDRFLRESEVRRITGLSRAQRHRLERAGRFPSRVPLSDRAFGWIEGEIRAWVYAYAGGAGSSVRTDSERVLINRCR